MSINISASIDRIAADARRAARLLQNVSAENINQAMLSMAGLLKANRPQIERENRRDIAAAARRGLSEAMIDRLTLS
ncbi:MAG: hypothetical protein PHC61_10605, partial [Chitinivibrionales bacterium]|nr:hypothetical protein [Chitinivibrionales bacterium]